MMKEKRPAKNSRAFNHFKKFRELDELS